MTDAGGDMVRRRRRSKVTRADAGGTAGDQHRSVLRPAVVNAGWYYILTSLTWITGWMSV
jgi:hypothetical protein